jgi:MFS family permease
VLYADAADRHHLIRLLWGHLITFLCRYNSVANIITAICRFAEPVVMTSVFPYLVHSTPTSGSTSYAYSSQPEMIESFGVGKKEVAKWAGITSAVFSLSQCLTAVLWGRASDYFGRKPTILIGLTMTMLSSLAWGISTSLPMAITVRAFAGGCNGNGMLAKNLRLESTDVWQWASLEPWLQN